MDQQALIARVVEALGPDPRITALFLSGSFGTGSADQFSDVEMTQEFDVIRDDR